MFETNWAFTKPQNAHTRKMAYMFFVTTDLQRKLNRRFFSQLNWNRTESAVFLKPNWKIHSAHPYWRPLAKPDKPRNWYVKQLCMCVCATINGDSFAASEPMKTIFLDYLCLQKLFCNVCSVQKSHIILVINHNFLENIRTIKC